MEDECQKIPSNECDGSSSTEGLIDDEEDEKENQEPVKEIEELDLLDSAFLRDGIILEPEKDSSRSGEDSDGLYDFKDTLGVPHYPSNITLKRSLALQSRQPRQSEYVYGKRYTARWVKRTDPSQLPSLMSLKVQPPERARGLSKELSDNDNESAVKSNQSFKRGDRKRLSSRRRSPSYRARNRSRSPVRKSLLNSRERVHRSPTSIERFRYWTGKEYRSRNRSSSQRGPRHP